MHTYKINIIYIYNYLPASNASTSSLMPSRLICVVCRIQFWVQINACTALGLNLLLYGSITRPPVEKADSDATVDMGMANTSRAIMESILNLLAFFFHQFNTSKSCCKEVYETKLKLKMQHYLNLKTYYKRKE